MINNRGTSALRVSNIVNPQSNNRQVVLDGMEQDNKQIIVDKAQTDPEL